MKRKVSGIGPINPGIAIVGEAPGAEEEKLGIPFVGRSGKLLNKMLKEAGIDREKCYITNVIKYRPPNNRTPTNKEIERAKKYLRAELRQINPKIIITLGNTAYKAISLNKEHFPLSSHHGNFNYSSVFDNSGCKLIPFMRTFHPSYCLRNVKYTDIVIGNFKVALAYLEMSK